MSAISIKEVKQMRENGCTYDEIAKCFGCNKQRIHQILHSKKAIGRDNFNKFIYKNISSWCKNNEIYTIGELKTILGFKCTDITLTNKMQGKSEFTISEIRKIIEVMGMDFEQCFLI